MTLNSYHFYLLNDVVLSAHCGARMLKLGSWIPDGVWSPAMLFEALGKFLKQSICNMLICVT